MIVTPDDTAGTLHRMQNRPFTKQYLKGVG